MANIPGSLAGTAKLKPGFGMCDRITGPRQAAAVSVSHTKGILCSSDLSRKTIWLLASCSLGAASLNKHVEIGAVSVT